MSLLQCDAMVALRCAEDYDFAYDTVPDIVLGSLEPCIEPRGSIPPIALPA